MPEPACPLCGARAWSPVRTGLRRCRRCDLHRAEPWPDPERLKALYDAQYYEAWGPRGGEDPAVAAMKERTFVARLSQLALRPGARVLDVGCATGFFLEVVRRVGGEPYGLEINPYAAEVAGHRFPGRVFRGTVAEAPWPRGFFQAAFLSDVLEHVPDPLAMLRGVFRLLAPGGAVVITTPDARSLSARLLGRHWFHLKAEHVVYFTLPSLRRALAVTGFHPLRLQRGRKAVTLAYLASHFRVYRRPVLTPLLGALTRILPSPWCRRPFWLPSGELLAVGCRPSGTAKG